MIHYFLCVFTSRIDPFTATITTLFKSITNATGTGNSAITFQIAITTCTSPTTTNCSSIVTSTYAKTRMVGLYLIMVNAVEVGNQVDIFVLFAWKNSQGGVIFVEVKNFW